MSPLTDNVFLLLLNQILPDHSKIIRILCTKFSVDLVCLNETYGSEIFRNAIQNGDETLVADIIECNATSIMVCTIGGKCPLHLASESGHTAVLSLLLEHPLVDVNKGDDEGQTALYVASEIGLEDSVNVILRQPDVNINKGRTTDGKTPLIVAAEEGRMSIVQLLTSHADIQVNKAKNTTGTTPLGTAATEGHVEIVKLLVGHPDIDIDKGDDLGQNALILAAINGHDEIIEVLIADSRTNVNQVTTKRKTALMEAAFNGNVPGVKLLLAHPDIGVNIATFNGKTALLYATLQQKAEIVTLLLRCPTTNTKMVDEEYKTALEYAQENGFTRIVEAFGSRGKLVTQNGHTCCSEAVDRGLIIATELDDISTVNNIFRCPTLDINVVNEEGFSSLYLAARANQLQMVKTLSVGPNIDINKHVVQNKETPLMVSSEAGYHDIVKLFLAHVQIDANKVDSHGISALQKAMAMGEPRHVRVVKLFLRCPMTYIPNYDGSQTEIAEAMDMQSWFLQMTPTCCKDVNHDLLSTAWQGDHRGIEGILRCPKAYIHVLDKKGRTPLFLASMRGHDQAVQVLLSSPNINLNIGHTKSGETAFSIASELGHSNVLAELIRSGWIIDGWCTDNWTPLLIKCKPETSTEQQTSTTQTLGGIFLN